MGSKCWDHFEKQPGLKAKCKHCDELLCHKNGTTRLNRHYTKTCPVRHPKPARSGQQGSNGSSAQEGIHNWQNASTFSKSRSDNSGQRTTAAAAAEDQLIKMIALHGFPSSVVEDEQFIKFVQMLCPDFKMPSRDDVGKRCDELFDQEMRNLEDALARTPGLVSLSLGKTDTDCGEIAYLAAHFIDEEWNFHCRVIEVFKALHNDYDRYDLGGILDIKDFFIDTPYVHWGPEDYSRIEDTISRWGILPKFSGFLVKNLGTINLGYHKDDRYEVYLPHLSTTQRELLCDIKLTWDLHMIASDSTLRRVSCKEDCLRAFKDENLKKKRREISSRLQLDHPWAYYHRWYLYYYALEIIHKVCSSRPAQVGALAGKFIFHETWITELFRTMLETIYHAIRTISAPSSPTSNLLLIEILKVRNKLVSEYSNGSARKQNTSGKLSERSKVEECLKFVENAIVRLDLAILYLYLSLSIPLILDPRFKLVYIENILGNASLPTDQISEVAEKFRRLFTEYNKKGPECSETEHNDTESNETEHPNHVYEMDVDSLMQGDGSTLQLSEQGNTISEENMRELEDYLQDETVPIDQEDFDILKWWKENCGRYPTVARIARDFLVIPTSGMPSPHLTTQITSRLRRYM